MGATLDGGAKLAAMTLCMWELPTPIHPAARTIKTVPNVVATSKHLQAKELGRAEAKIGKPYLGHFQVVATAVGAL